MIFVFSSCNKITIRIFKETQKKVQKIMCMQRTSGARSAKSLPAGVQGMLRVLEALGFYMLFHAIWALFWSILIQNWKWKDIVDQTLERVCTCCAPSWWIRHCLNVWEKIEKWGEIDESWMNSCEHLFESIIEWQKKKEVRYSHAAQLMLETLKMLHIL